MGCAVNNLDDLVERLALSDGIALGSYGAGSDQGSVAAEALLQMFTRPTFNPLVLLSELQARQSLRNGWQFFSAFEQACACLDVMLLSSGVTRPDNVHMRHEAEAGAEHSCYWLSLAAWESCCAELFCSKELYLVSKFQAFLVTCA